MAVDCGKQRTVDKVKLGKKIDMLRLDAGYTQQQLADQVYVTVKTVRNWIKGRKICNIDSLRLLAEVFLMEPDELLEGCYDE